RHEPAVEQILPAQPETEARVELPLPSEPKAITEESIEATQQPLVEQVLAPQLEAEALVEPQTVSEPEPEPAESQPRDWDWDVPQALAASGPPSTEAAPATSLGSHALPSDEAAEAARAAKHAEDALDRLRAAMGPEPANLSPATDAEVADCFAAQL